MAIIGFGELVGLMVWGSEAPDTCRGLLREVDEDGERRTRVSRDGYRTHRETEDGQVLHILGRDAEWHWDAEADVMRVRRHENDLAVTYGRSPIGGLQVGGHRPSWSRWEGADFTRPSSSVEPTEFAGRPCWTVELAPPQHKPFPLRLTVDAATGLVLRTENAGFGMVTEWLDVEIGIDIADDEFVWTGPAEPLPTHAERMLEHEADVAQRQAWLAGRGLATIALPTRIEVMPHEWDDDTGAFYASVRSTLSATLLRRPASDEPWDEPGTTHYDHTHRWADARWDWFLGTDDALAPDELAALQAQLRTTT